MRAGVILLASVIGGSLIAAPAYAQRGGGCQRGSGMTSPSSQNLSALGAGSMLGGSSSIASPQLNYLQQAQLAYQYQAQLSYLRAQMQLEQEASKQAQAETARKAENRQRAIAERRERKESERARNAALRAGKSIDTTSSPKFAAMK